MSGAGARHIDILSDRQKTVLSQLAAALADTDFYMAGGTALALQLGHRPSVDFDWFISRLGEPENLLQRLDRFDIDYRVQSVDVETVYLDIKAVQVSFIGYKYPLLQSPIFFDESIKLAGTDDIACMKLSAIASRGSRKDFIDLHFMISTMRPLDAYLRLYLAKFRNRDMGHVLKSLVYFEDADMEPEVITAKPFDWLKMKTDFENWVKKIE